MEVDFVTSDIVQEETIDADNDYSNFEGERCGICMDIVFDRGVLDCCQHWFCFTCIDNWATITNLCPLCQNEFQLITCVPVYDTIGSNKVDDDSFSRDDDWCVEGKNNTLSFPSYYIDENESSPYVTAAKLLRLASLGIVCALAVICLDGDECKIRSGSANMEEDSNLDTSIACDSCDIWYHAFCVGFDPEGTSEDTWLCPRCVAGKVPQKFDATSIQRPTKQCGAESCYTSSLPEATFSGKLSVSVADAGETAVVVSMVDEDKRSEEASEKFCSVLEVDKNLNFDAVDGNSLKEETPSGEKNEIQPIMEGQGLELSLSHDTSLVLSELKSSCADSAVNPPNSNDDVNSCLRKLLNDSNAGNKLSESETSIGLHLVNHMKNNGTEDQGAGDIEQKNLAEEPLLREEKILCDANEEAVKMIGLKRTQMDRRSMVTETVSGRYSLYAVATQACTFMT
ncbi:hypothetical protein RCOM_1692360 [Ricinus communis]|uniref:RING-type domain-containing protein n=1 Tax=Ricinus communis TaxID=3988 RepID=B9RCU9_RICCO|nr:hypothetical protein RCOM_1692360 [Ricinus communis]